MGFFKLALVEWGKHVVCCGILFLYICSGGVYAQETITGTVTDAGSSETLPGVNILVKGTTTGTSTDQDGNYQLDVSSLQDTLVVTYIGYQRLEEPINGRTEIAMQLTSEAIIGDEMIVTGYGSQSRRNVTGSISKVDMEDTENLPNTNITQALRGRVAGVQFTDSGRPGQGGSLLIRGPRSLSGGNSPLIVLDGIYFNGALSEINPNNIESIEVLKDASATAIYGSRAANGVILITSKKGEGTGRPTINLNFDYGLSDWSNKLNLLSPERYVQKAKDIRNLRDVSYNPNDPSTFLTITEYQNFIQGKTVNPYEKISQQGRIFSGDLSLSGRYENLNYYVSGSLSREEGLVLDDNFQRASLRANLESEITDWLTIGTNSMFSQIDESGVPASISLVARQSPFGTWYREDGTPTQFTVPEDQVSRNPLRNNYLSRNEYKKSNLLGSFYGLVKIPKVDGLSLKVNYSNNYRRIRDYNVERQDPYLSSNASNASKRNWAANDWVLENILKYQFELNEDHAFDVTLLYGSYGNSYETTTASSSQLASDILDWDSLELGTTLTNTSHAEEESGTSSMARLNYRLLDRYLFTVTARRDGSSVFAENNKYGTFPSAAIAWIASDEEFVQNVEFIDFLKFRASYGAVGNQAISPYQSLSLANLTRYVFGNGGDTSIGAHPSNISNPNLKWETSYKSNVALDFSLFNDRLAGTIELYNTDTKDLLVERRIPVMTGFESIWTNIGEVNNRGVELSLNTVNLKSGKFEWSSELVFSHNKNKIVSLYGIDSDGDGREDDDIGNGWFIGEPINAYYDYVFDGIYQEGAEMPSGYRPGFARFKDLNGDGEVEAQNDRTIVGKGGEPKYRWGLSNTFTYGNFSLSVFINAMQGWIGTFNDLDHYDDSIDPMRPANMLDFGWWTPENKSNSRPSLDYSRSSLGHNWYRSRNFVRVQDVSLSYSFSQKQLSRAGISEFNVFISGKNVLTFTNWPGVNPESPSSDRYPIPRTFTTGFRLSF